MGLTRRSLGRGLVTCAIGALSLGCGSSAGHRRVTGPPPEYELSIEPDAAAPEAADAANAGSSPAFRADGSSE